MRTRLSKRWGGQYPGDRVAQLLGGLARREHRGDAAALGEEVEERGNEHEVVVVDADVDIDLERVVAAAPETAAEERVEVADPGRVVPLGVGFRGPLGRRGGRVTDRGAGSERRESAAGERDGVPRLADRGGSQLLEPHVADPAFVELLADDGDEPVDEVLDPAGFGFLEDHDDIGVGVLDQVLLQGHDELFHLESVLVGHTLEGVDDEERLVREHGLDPVVAVLDLRHRVASEQRGELGAVDPGRRAALVGDRRHHVLGRRDLGALIFGQLLDDGLVASVERVQEQFAGIEDAGPQLAGAEPRELAVKRFVTDAGGEVERLVRFAHPLEQFEAEGGLPGTGATLHDEGTAPLAREERRHFQRDRPAGRPVVSLHPWNRPAAIARPNVRPGIR